MSVQRFTPEFKKEAVRHIVDRGSRRHLLKDRLGKNIDES
jgi:hypothetical protein